MKALAFSIRAGMGHIKAGEAIEEGINSIQGASCKHFVLLEGTRAGWFINSSYLWMARYLPWLWGLLYKKDFLYKNTGYFEHRINEEAQRIIKEEKPDCICSLHPFITKALSKIKRDFKLISIATDFDFHPIGTKDNVDMFIVPHKSSLESITKNGVSPEKVKVIGIPIGSKFSRNNGIRKKDFGFSPKPIVLEIGGGYGLCHIGRFIPFLAKYRELFQVIVVTGKNEVFKERLENILKRYKIEGKIFGFVDNVDELMEISDIMIGKPGGLTIMEACAKGLPIIITGVIKGQEEVNAKVLIEEGIAIMPKSNDIPYILKSLLEDKEKRRKMRRNALKFSKPFANIEIAKAIIKEVR